MSNILKPDWAADLASIDYDLAICALGYESRCRSSAEKYEKQCVDAKKLAFSFDLNNYIAYATNLDVFEKLGYEIIPSSDDGLSSILKESFSDSRFKENKSNVLVDISSFSRYRLGKILEELYRLLPTGSKIFFNYTVSTFEDPKPSTAPITKLSPLTPFYAGIPSSPNKTLTCLMGLGYEEDRALGALEFLEIGETIIFKPISLDSRYDFAVDSANEILLNDVESQKIISYEMEAPSRIYSILDATVKGIVDESRIVTIPFGPKIFALISLLVSINNYPNMPIWSVSSIKDDPVDRKPSGEILTFSVEKINMDNDSQA